jgi:hypothetical protein
MYYPRMLTYMLMTLLPVTETVNMYHILMYTSLPFDMELGFLFLRWNLTHYINHAAELTRP